MESVFKAHLPQPSKSKTQVPCVSEKEDVVYTFECLDFQDPPRTMSTSRRRSVWDKAAKQDVDVKAACMAAFMKSSESVAQSFVNCDTSAAQNLGKTISSPKAVDDLATGELQNLYLDSVALLDKNKNGRKGSNEGDNGTSGISKEGTRTPTESLASGRASSKGTSICASPPPESSCVAADNCRYSIRRTSKPAFRYSVVEECVNDKVEFKRILRRIGQNAEFKYRTIRGMFVAADADGDGKLTLHETVHLFANFGLESDLAEKFFRFLDKDRSGEIDWLDFMASYGPMASFGPVFNEKRSSSARDRRRVPQRHPTWRAVPGPIPGMQRMMLA